MSEFYEIDFLDVESKRSGDAIAVRYDVEGEIYIHVVDGGFQATGEKLADHINKYYDNPSYIDHVVATHPDQDHAGGLRTILEDFTVGTLWMLRPWDYADELIDRFQRFTSVENLRKRLREIYPNIDALEEIANEKGITILEPFQGKNIAAFTVVSPTKGHYLDMIVESDKTPEAVKIAEEDSAIALGVFELLKKAVSFVKAVWGEEVFSSEETSSENEMSVVQYADLCDHRILLTGDAGRTGLSLAADYTIACGVALPGIDKFQVPHHGSRRNVSTEVLDRWLGECRDQGSESTFSAIVSASKEDEDHPKKAVVRACIHRGANVVSTEGQDLRVSKNAPEREGWIPATSLPYPDDQEE